MVKFNLMCLLLPTERLFGNDKQALMQLAYSLENGTARTKNPSTRVLCGKAILDIFRWDIVII